MASLKEAAMTRIIVISISAAFILFSPLAMTTSSHAQECINNICPPK